MLTLSKLGEKVLQECKGLQRTKCEVAFALDGRPRHRGGQTSYEAVKGISSSGGSMPHIFGY